MKKIGFIIAFFSCFFSLNAQVKYDSIDSQYREDQLYVSFSYNLLNNRLTSDSNSLFSGGFSLGYIYDLPFNERRNAGLGIGLGYAYNSYQTSFYMNVGEEDELYQTSSFKTQLIEMPIELRWRTSTASDYNFWRIYCGVKFAYLIHSKSKFKLEEEIIELTNFSALQKINYGLTLSAGYGSWNIFAYYGLNPLFDDISVGDKKLNVKDFSLGLKFYIL